MTHTESTAAARLESTLIAAIRLVHAIDDASAKSESPSALNRAASIAPWAIEIETKCGRVVHLVCANAWSTPDRSAQHLELACHDGPYIASGHRIVHDLTTEAAIAFAHRPRVIALRAAPDQTPGEWSLSFDNGGVLAIRATPAGPRLQTPTPAPRVKH